MATDEAFAEVFDRLKAILAVYADRLVVVDGEQRNLSLNTSQLGLNKKPLFFGAVQIKKNYVSYHLLPLYTDPDLLDGFDAELRKRMQGKACFNFTEPDDVMFDKLADLTRQGFERFEHNGLL